MDVDEGHFICPDLGHTVLKLTSWKPGKRSAKIDFCTNTDEAILEGAKIGDGVSPSVKGSIKTLLRNFWDVFSQKGLKHPMIGFEFCLDTGSHTPYCCRKPSYGVNESKIMMSHITKLLDMG